MYNLEYYLGGNLVETVLWNKPWPICKWKEKQLKANTHTIGTFRICKNK